MTADRVLITGVNGCVGRAMANHVLANHGTVVGIGRSPSISPAPPFFHYQVCDLRDKEAVDHLIATVQPTHVVHAAGIANASQSWQAPINSVTTNGLGTVHLLEAIRKHGADVSRVLVIGSSHEYRMNGKFRRRLSERAEIAPSSPYGWSKYVQTSAAQMYADFYGLPIIVARTFHLIGPGCNQGVCGELTRQVVRLEQGKVVPRLSVGNPLVQRDFLDVRDAVEAYWQLLHMTRAKRGDVYNVCSGKAITISHIIECLRKEVDVQFSVVIDRALAKPNEPRLICGNPGKLEHATRWRPTISIEKSIEDMLGECRAQFWWDSCDKED